MMLPDIRLIRAVQLVFFCATASVAIAAEPILLLPETIPNFQYFFALALSSMGGLASSLKRWSVGVETKNVKLSIVSDAVSSVCSGMITFFGALHFAPPSAVAVILIFMAGYGGARFLDFIYGKMEAFIGRKIDKASD
jgi:hypothetical protein